MRVPTPSFRGKALWFGFLLALGVGWAHHRAEPAYSGRPHGEWVKLGERAVDGRRDRDVIAVGAREGTCRRIMIVVERGPIEMFDVVVTFGDGTQFAPHTRAVFNPLCCLFVFVLFGGCRVFC